VTRSRNIYISWVIPSSLLPFHGKTAFYGDFMSPATIIILWPSFKETDNKFNRNPSSRSRADTREQMDRQAYMTKILGACHTYATALKNGKGNINSSLVKATTNSSVSQVKCHHFATELYHYFAVKERNSIN
jgi:hypothetical protein